MKCPHCKEPLIIPYHSVMNADQYGTSNMVATECCGRGITVIPLRRYDVEPYDGSEITDDWGHEIKKTKKKTLARARNVQ